MGMNIEWEKVKEFHKLFNHPFSESPTMIDSDMAKKRYNWMREEIDEFLSATDIVGQADAMIDLIYFALGSLVIMGVKPEKLFDIVHTANMTKVGDGGKPIYKPDGKIKKPDSWKDPHLLIKKAIEDMKNEV
ncbi:MAG: HAD family hydrolase [Firmicutes bacterium]|nr:HAD family hydrolase [Bacillota bacterium]MCL2177575.1 HAD family hydrolase [Bacillota bacterium]